MGSTGKQINLIHGSTNKPTATAALIELVNGSNCLTGDLIIGWPVSVDAVLVSDNGQVTVIDLVESNDPGEYRDRQDRAFNKVNGLIMLSDKLRDGRKPLVNVQSITMTIRDTAVDLEDKYHPLAGLDTIAFMLERFQQESPHGVCRDDVMKQVLWVPPAY